MISASNEVVNFTEINTGEIRYKLIDEDALHGQVKCLKVSHDMLAIGYNDGAIKVYKLQIHES